MELNALTHILQRLAGESFGKYKERRALAKKIVKRATTVPSGNQTSRQQLREAQHSNGRMKTIAGSYGRGLTNHFTRRQLAVLKANAR